MVKQKITLNAYSNKTVTVNAVQGEVNSRFLEIILEDNYGAVNLHNKSVQIYMEKPDGNIVYNNVEISDAHAGKITVCLTSEISAVPGIINEIEIRVTDINGNTLKFKGLTLIILRGLPDNNVESHSEFTALQINMGALTEINNHINLNNNPHNVTAEQIGALPSATKIPNKTSDLQNDSGFLTSYTETDPTVPAWAKEQSKPTYTAEEVGALPSTTKIPNKTSDLQNDSGFLTSYTETDPTVPAWAKEQSKPTYTAEEVGAVPIIRTINSKPLSEDITLTPTDINLNVVEGTLSFTSNVLQSYDSYIKKVGNIVILYLKLQLNGYLTDTSIQICTIPTGFRPISGMVNGAFISKKLSDSKLVAYSYIGKTGTMVISDSTSSSCEFAFLNTTYITE